MKNKKVLIAPAASCFDKYIKTHQKIVRIACYSATVFPFDDVQAVQRHFNEILKLNNWKISGVYTDDNSIQNNKNNFEKLLNKCRNNDIDVVVCDLLENLPKRPEQLIQLNIPIYVLEKGLLFDNENYRIFPD
jgi:diphthamide synthase subunit DPH2